MATSYKVEIIFFKESSPLSTQGFQTLWKKTNAGRVKLFAEAS